MQAYRTLNLPKAVAFAAFTLFNYSTCLHTHEYWIAPLKPVIKAGSSALINIKNGENFNGPTYPYNPERAKSVSITDELKTQSYTGRLGDYPAISPKLSVTGIHSIAIETNAQQLTYDSWEKFTNFLDYHGFNDVQQRHLKRGLPRIDISESYSRSAKTFVQVTATGIQTDVSNDANNVQDHKAFAPVGHDLEMILLNSPYGEIATLTIQLLFNGKPLNDRQAEMFWKDEKVERIIATTNAEGIASFVLSGKGKYLLNAVQLTEANKKDVHWISHWASITFTRQ